MNGDYNERAFIVVKLQKSLNSWMCRILVECEQLGT